MAGNALKCIERIMDRFVNTSPKTTVVYQQESIDYEKLAEAIVEAQKKVLEDEKKVQETVEKETSEKTKYSRGTFAVISALILRLFTFVGVVLGIAVLIFIYENAKNMEWVFSLGLVKELCPMVIYLFIAVALFALSFLWWKAAKEIEETADSSYVATIFSGLMAAIAVIVAIISLIITR